MIYRFFSLILATLAPIAWGQPTGPYVNWGSEVNQIVISGMIHEGVRVNDTFINEGLFRVQFAPNTTTIPSYAAYSMTGIANYTNNNTFQGQSVRLELINPNGSRQPAEVFVNTVNGRLDMADGFHFFDPISQSELVTTLYPTLSGWDTPISSFRINARQIANHGLMRVGAGGVLQLGSTNASGQFTAELVDLTGATLATDRIGRTFGQEITDATGDGFYFTVNTAMPPVPISYLNPVGFQDVFWDSGLFTNQGVGPGQFLVSTDPTTIISPPGNPPNQRSLFLTDAQSWAFTQEGSDPTNILYSAVFVQTGSTNVRADVRWSNNALIGPGHPNSLPTAIVRLESISTNVFSLEPEVNTLYIWDELGSFTNVPPLLVNERIDGGSKPANIFVSRRGQAELAFLTGIESNTVVTPDFFYTDQYATRVVTNIYSAYDFSLDNYVYRVPLVPANPFAPQTSVYDLPGRVEIKGRVVDLTDTWIQGEGLISIEADEIKGITPKTLLDAQNLSFKLTSSETLQPFRFENLAKPLVARFGGSVSTWSGVFTNVVTNIFTNTVTNVDLTISNTFTTNFDNHIYHVLMVNAAGLRQTLPVTVADFNVRAQSLDIVDSMIVSNRFTSTASNLNVSGTLQLRGAQWGPTNFPNLANLTIAPTGNLFLFGQADFGTSFRPLATFTNQGAISSYSQTVVAQDVDISGSMISAQLLGFGFFENNAGPINITATRSARVDGGDLLTYGNIFFNGPVFKFNDASVTAGGTIRFSLTNGVLEDSGLLSGNTFAASNGFSLNGSITAGTLLGSSIIATPPPRGRFTTTWSVPASASTAITNIPTATANWTQLTNETYAAISAATVVGRLQLESGVNTVFEFRGTAPRRALYVDLIEINASWTTNLTSLVSQLTIVSNAQSSIDIYYADIVVSTNIQLNLGFQSLAEWFNGRTFGGGTFRWMPNFNGPNTSEDVVFDPVSGASVSMNRALRRSQIIDSDGDGIANSNDDLPFSRAAGQVSIASVGMASVDGHIEVTFNAYRGTYILQTATELDPNRAKWETAATYEHPTEIAIQKKLRDPKETTGTQRFYRVLYMP